MNIYIVYWSRGPADNPDNGQIEVVATSAWYAIEAADQQGISHKDIDAIVRKNVLEDLFPT